MKNDIVFPKIIDYLKVNKKASIGEIYIRFHMMNKININKSFNVEEITAQDIVSSIDIMYKKGIIDFEDVDGEKLYYIV